jgi:hypothetical protein
MEEAQMDPGTSHDSGINKVEYRKAKEVKVTIAKCQRQKSCTERISGMT